MALLTTISMPPNCRPVASSGGLHRGFLAHVDLQRQRAAAGLLDLGGGGVDGALSLGCGSTVLAAMADVGAVASCLERDRQPDAARSAGDEQVCPSATWLGPRNSAAWLTRPHRYHSRRLRAPLICLNAARRALALTGREPFCGGDAPCRAFFQRTICGRTEEAGGHPRSQRARWR